MTFRQVMAEKGLEPDECYWTLHAADVLGGWREGLPPPDYCVEIEISSSVLNRLGIYAALEVPEIWRVQSSGKINLLFLDSDTYKPGERSRAVPGFDPSELEPYLAQVGIRTASSILTAFRNRPRSA